MKNWHWLWLTKKIKPTQTLSWNAIYKNGLFALDLDWCHRVNLKIFVFEIIVHFLKVDGESLIDQSKIYKNA